MIVARYPIPRCCVCPSPAVAFGLCGKHGPPPDRPRRARPPDEARPIVAVLHPKPRRSLRDDDSRSGGSE